MEDVHSDMFLGMIFVKMEMSMKRQIFVRKIMIVLVNIKKLHTKIIVL